MAVSPWCVVVAGVSGSGKSTVAEKIATMTGAVLADGDAFHTAEAVGRMRGGTPLTDRDRLPWLEAIGAWISEQHRRGQNTVVSCSALRKDYRDVLITNRPWVRFCLLDVPAEILRQRLADRTGHFMPSTLLPSQLALLEPLTPEEAGTTTDGTGTPQDVARRALTELHLP